MHRRRGGSYVACQSTQQMTCSRALTKIAPRPDDKLTEDNELGRLLHIRRSRTSDTQATPLRRKPNYRNLRGCVFILQACARGAHEFVSLNKGLRARPRHRPDTRRKNGSQPRPRTHAHEHDSKSTSSTHVTTWSISNRPSLQTRMPRTSPLTRYAHTYDTRRLPQCPRRSRHGAVARRDRTDIIPPWRVRGGKRRRGRWSNVTRW